ncbi:hypothetical protein B0H13DRAFT_247101 [Mycena leptocephala]|nr:hypothetical protein B0H13DRAFT_247101 [Mycena leptocephala]
MTIQSTFPRELVDEILEYVGDFRSLKASSLVCRDWVSRSRSHLFKVCSLWPSKIPSFCDLLRSPECTIVPHVRSIRDLKHYGPQDYDSFRNIAADLGRLTNVRELEMTFSTSYRPEKINPFLSTAFPSIALLVLTFDQTPLPLVDMISVFPALQELDIEVSGAVMDIPSDTVPPRELCRLALSRNSVGPILTWLDAVDHLPNIHSLKLPSLRLSDVPTVRAALQRLGGALHHLGIDLRGVDDGVNTFDVFNLSLHRNLITLDMDFSWAYSEAHVNAMIPWITKLMAPTIECLSLELDLSRSVYQSFDWAALDAFLSSARFPRLRSVTFKCPEHGNHEYYDYAHENDDDEEPDIDTEHKFLRGALPLLEASGVLQEEW